MMALARIFSFIFSFILLTQHTAWATGVQASPEGKVSMQKNLELYQSLTQEGYVALLQFHLKHRPKEDQEYAAKLFGDFSKVLKPVIKRDGDSFTVMIRNKTYSALPLGKNVVRFEGKELDFSPGKLADAMEELQTHLTNKTSSVFDYFISSAHAFTIEDAGVILGILLMLAMFPLLGYFGYLFMTSNSGLAVLSAFLSPFVAGGAGAALVGISASKADAKNIHWNEVCSEFSNRLLSAKSKGLNQNDSDWQKLSSEVKNTIKNPSFLPNCQAKMAELVETKKDQCEEILACLKKIDKDLDEHVGSINNTDRGTIKDIPAARGKNGVPTKAVQQQ